MTIKVLKNWNGLRGEVVEVIERKATRVKNCDRRGRRMGPEYKTVSYKGERFAVFAVPPCYGAELSGMCISL